MTSSQNLSPVQSYYKGKTIFITGASGFMGKVLVEKLLYSCSELKEILVLVRPKKGKVPESRLEDMFKLPMFQRIRDEKPEVLKKVKAIQGDITFDNVGLSGEIEARVVQSTNIVFHCAATLRLEAKLKDAIEMNTSGTKRILTLCKKMTNLEVMVHLSTAFCYCDREVLPEKVFDCPHNPEEIMRCAEWMDEKTLDLITPNLLKPHPNTYTYSKRLSEMLVRDEYPNLPVCIARPSIVCPANEEPLPGWVDSLNGPIGVLIGGGKGIIRTMLCDGELKSQTIPVDYAIAGLITIAFTEGLKKEKNEKDIPVYNMNAIDEKNVTWGEVLNRGKAVIYKYPFEAGLWYPNGEMTANRPLFLFYVFIFHSLPAYFIDFLMFCFGKKRFMCHVQEKVFNGLDILSFFTTRDWRFNSEKFHGISKSLTPLDRKLFDTDTNNVDVDTYMYKVILGGRQYCLKEPLSSLNKARMHLKVQYVVDKLAKLLLLGLLIWSFLRFNSCGRAIKVTPAWSEPLPGWVDSLNGPVGVMIGGGKGVIRSMLCDGSLKSEVIPVDFAIAGLITIAYTIGTTKSANRPKDIPVYNMNASEEKKVTWGETLNRGKAIAYDFPFEAGCWYPNGTITTNRIVHTLNIIFFHWLPAYLIDFLMLCCGQKRFMCHVQTRISDGLEVLQFFTTRAWNFKTEKFEGLVPDQSPQDAKIFNMDKNCVEVEEYMLKVILGGRQYCLKEPLTTLPKARMQLKALYILDRVTKIFFLCLFVWIFLKVTGLKDILADFF